MRFSIPKFAIICILCFFPITDLCASERLSFKFNAYTADGEETIANSAFPFAYKVYRTATGDDLLCEEQQIVETVDGVFFVTPGQSSGDSCFQALDLSDDNQEAWLEFEIDGDVLYPRSLISELPQKFWGHGEAYDVALSAWSDEMGAAPQPAAITIGKTIDYGSNLNMGASGITLGGVTRSAWPEGMGNSYKAGTALELDGDTFNVLDAPIRQWAIESVEFEGFVRPFDLPTCGTGFMLVHNSDIPSWDCIPYEPGNSVESIRSLAREEAYDTPPEVDSALSGLGYIKVNPADCNPGYVPTYGAGGWACAAIPNGGGGQYWGLAGTSGTTRGIHYLGTSDNTGLDLRVNEMRAVSYYLPTVNSQQTAVPAKDHSPNIVAGYSDNTLIHPDDDNCLLCPLYAVGRTISGGGMEAAQHRVLKDFGTVGGGLANWVDGYAGAIGGGEHNSVGATHGAISGGYLNGADGNYSVVGGGYENEADGDYSAVFGGVRNKAFGKYSVAAGAYARVPEGHESTFVWNSATTTEFFESTGSHQFLIKAGGGVGVGTNDPTAQLTVNGAIRSKDVNGKGYALYAESGSAEKAVEAANNSTSGGTGVYAYSLATSGNSYGVYGISKNEEIPASGALALTAGVQGRHTPASGTGRGAGVWGDTTSATAGAAGVFGEAIYGLTNGVYGYNSSDSDGAAGVKGYAAGAGAVIGVLGKADSASGWAVYADGNARVTGDLVVNGNIRSSATRVISYGPEHWQSRFPDTCPIIKLSEYGTHAFLSIGPGTCYNAPELNTWLVKEGSPPPLGFRRQYWICTDTEIPGCGANTEKPKISPIVRMPLEIPHGSTLKAVKVNWSIDGSPVADGCNAGELDDLNSTMVVALYARPAGAEGWWGFPNKKDALGWACILDQNPNVDTDPAPFLYTVEPPPNTVVDNNAYTYFVEVNLAAGENRLYEVYVDYSY